MRENMTEEERKRDFLEAELRKRCLAAEVVDEALDGCRRTFDSFFCWPVTRPGELAKQNCTNGPVKSENLHGIVTRQCTSNGTWFVRYGHDWTNFSDCGELHYTYAPIDQDEEIFNRTSELFKMLMPHLNKVTATGYTLSIIALFVAMAIFIWLKSLRCERNKLHMNLFISYLANATMHLTKMALFEDGVTFSGNIEHENNGTWRDINYTWDCKFFTTLQFYFGVANFMFLLMEGLYLRNLIFLNLYSESHGTAFYCIIGWVAPIFAILTWVILKITKEDTHCWSLDKKNINLFIEVPVAVTVIANLVLFVIIMRVLIRKIHFTSTFIQNKKIKYRQLIRSTLILIPLYGIPFTVSVILHILTKTGKDPVINMVYIFFDQSISSFQGFFAALVYCLLNSDIKYEVIRKYSTLIDQANQEFRRSRTISTNTQQFSLQNTEDGLENVNLFGLVDDDPSVKTNGHHH